MSASWYLGVDFGTSFTVVATSRDGTTNVVDVESNGSSRMPSSVFFTQDEEFLVGTAAIHQAVFSPERFEPTPKRAIGEEEIFLGDRLIPIVDLVAAVLRRVYNEACRQEGETVPAAICLTHPADWSAVRLNVLREAVEKSGMRSATLVPEPVAAATRFAMATPTGSHIAVYDFGGGTMDAAVLTRTAEDFVVAGQPAGRDPLGGEDIDRRIIDYVGTLVGEDEPAWTALLNAEDTKDRHNAATLRAEVRRAKETLSEVSACQLWLPGLERAIQLTRSELEGLISADVDATVDTLQRALEDARVAPADLAGIYLIGGSSRIPLVADTIWRRLGTRPIVQDNPKSVVALGAAGWTPESHGVSPPAGAAASRPGSRGSSRAASSMPTVSTPPGVPAVGLAEVAAPAGPATGAPVAVPLPVAAAPAPPAPAAPAPPASAAPATPTPAAPATPTPAAPATPAPAAAPPTPVRAPAEPSATPPPVAPPSPLPPTPTQPEAPPVPPASPALTRPRPSPPPAGNQIAGAAPPPAPPGAAARAAAAPVRAPGGRPPPAPAGAAARAAAAPPAVPGAGAGRRPAPPPAQPPQPPAVQPPQTPASPQAQPQRLVESPSSYVVTLRRAWRVELPPQLEPFELVDLRPAVGEYVDLGQVIGRARSTTRPEEPWEVRSSCAGTVWHVAVAPGTNVRLDDALLQLAPATAYTVDGPRPHPAGPGGVIFTIHRPGPPDPTISYVVEFVGGRFFVGANIAFFILAPSGSHPMRVHAYRAGATVFSKSNNITVRYGMNTNVLFDVWGSGGGRFR